MKRTAALCCALALCASLAGCGGGERPSLETDGAQDGAGAVQATPSPEPAVSKEDELLAFDGEHIEAADYELRELLALTQPFCVCSEEFTDPSQLSDSALFFSAVTKLDSFFEPLSDGYTYALDIKEIAPALRAMFGPNAALSEGWQSGSYEPYQVDAAGGQVLKYSLGQTGCLNYTYACVKTDGGGWELWLLNLYDPLFADVNPGVIESGDASSVKWDMVAPYAERMQTGIFTISSASGGGYVISGFRYRNFKDVGGYSY